MILLILFDVSEYSYGDYYSMLSDVFVVDTVPSEQVTESESIQLITGKTTVKKCLNVKKALMD